MEWARSCSEVSVPRSFPVVLSIFLMACSQVGTIKSMGIYLEDISRSLGTTSTDIGVALGLFTALSYFPAPLIVVLYRLESFRRVILISGAGFISLGVILTAFASNNVLIAVYLAISGLGHCILTISTVLALDQHASSQHFDFLFGVGMSGFGVGMVLLPFLADVLGQVYGWRGGLLILGGLMANLVPCTMTIQAGLSSTRNRLRNYDLRNNACQKSSPSEERCIGDCSPDEDETSPLYQENSEFSTSQHGLQHKSFNEDPSSNSAVVDQMQRESEERVTRSERLLDRIRTCISRSDFYMDPVINLIFAGTLVYGVMYCGWHAFLVPHAIQRGYSVHSTIIMTLFASVGNFLGRLLAGAFSSRLTNPIGLFLAAALLNALAILSDAFIHHYYVLTATACISAVSIAGMSVLGPLIVKRRASIENFDIIYAVNEVSFGCGTFLGGYLSGLVGDIFSNYNTTFLFLAGVDVLVFLLMLPPLIIKKPHC